MFDEQNQNPNAPKNLPTEPVVDMFAGVEKDEGGAAAMPKAAPPDALGAGLLKKKDEMAAAMSRAASVDGGKMSAPILGKILLALLIVALLGGLGYGGWWFFYSSKNKSTTTSVESVIQTNQNQSAQTPAATSVTNVPATSTPAQTNNDQILFGQAVDSDKDGLDDVREQGIGTNPLNSDTDGDGLSDGDEVVIYKTNPLQADTDNDGLSDGDEVLIWHSNPLNADTDGDSYPDGTEVKNGYNPVGPGKLFTSPSSTPTSTI